MAAEGAKFTDKNLACKVLSSHCLLSTFVNFCLFDVFSNYRSAMQTSFSLKASNSFTLRKDLKMTQLAARIAERQRRMLAEPAIVNAEAVVVVVVKAVVKAVVVVVVNVLPVLKERPPSQEASAMPSNVKNALVVTVADFLM